MQRFDRYIAKNLLTTTLFAVTILSGVFLLGNIFKKARPLLVGNNPSPSLILEFIVSVIPYSLLFTLPFSFLAAVMLVFGRLSADNEILSMRMTGRSLPRIALPVFIVATLFSCFCFWLNAEASPKAKARVENLLYDALKDDPNKFLEPGVVQTHLADKRIYVRERSDSDNDNILYGLHIHDISKLEEEEEDKKSASSNESTSELLEENQELKKAYASKSSVYAESAKLEVDIENSNIILKLNNAFAMHTDSNGTKIPVSIGEVNPVIFSFNNKKKRRVKASAMTNNEIRAYLKENTELSTKKRAEFVHAITSRQSFSLACLAFALIGVPLGIGAKRKDSSTGFILSILIGLGYFLFHIFAKQIEDDTSTISTILFWLPNILALIIGIWLFRRFKSK